MFLKSSLIRQIDKSIINIFGSGALSGKMLLVRIVKNNEIDAYFRAGYVE